MVFKRSMLLAAAPFALAVSATPASAQGIPVFDTSTYLQALAQVQNTVKMIQQGEQQIQQAQQTFNSLSKLTNMSEIAPTLNLPQVRNLFSTPTSVDVTAIASGDLSKLGQLGTLASSIQARYRLSSGSDADVAYNQALADATGSAAVAAAVGENTLSATQARTQGLDQLRAQLASAKDPKDVMDLQARIAVEQAQLQNDMLKIQAVQMAQAAQSSLAASTGEAAAGRDAAAFYQANILRK